MQLTYSTVWCVMYGPLLFFIVLISNSLLHALTALVRLLQQKWADLLFACKRPSLTWESSQSLLFSMNLVSAVLSPTT